MKTIDKISIKNFKNILKAELDISDLNLIVGSNNSGKTNFLQAFQFLDFLINSSNDAIKLYFARGDDSVNGQIIPVNVVAPITKIEIGFSDSDDNLSFNYVIEIGIAIKESLSLYIDKESYSFKIANKPGPYITIFSRNGDNINFGSEFSKTTIIEKVQPHISVIRLLNLISEKNPYKKQLSVLNYILKTPIFYFSNFELNNLDAKDKKDSHGRTVSYNITDEIISLENTSNFKILKTILNRILKIDDIEIVRHEENKLIPHQNFIVFQQFGGVKLLNSFSDGSILLISLITKILSSKHCIFFLEEPENSLHPKALVELFNFIKSFLREKQFLIVSHSLTLLNISNPSNVIITQVNEKGQSIFENVSTRKDILKKLKEGYTDFSDFIFFN
jgi:predicted ATP-dependent endonuclease of OLD family